jgi:hypothetical protein
VARRWCCIGETQPLPGAPGCQPPHQALPCSHHQLRAGPAQAVPVGGRQRGGGVGGGGGGDGQAIVQHRTHHHNQPDHPHAILLIVSRQS